MDFHIKHPEVYEAVILYHDRGDLIRKYILDPIDVSSTSIDPMSINIHYLVLKRFILLIFVNRKALNQRKMIALFTEAHILSYTPKLVITLIDDCAIFSQLSKYCHDTEFFAIQNGSRSIWQLKREHEKIYLTNFFCFGQHTVDLYKKYGKTIENPILSGSLISDIYYYDIEKSNNKKIDVCLVDHWVSKDLDVLYGDDSNHYDLNYVRTLKILDQHLRKYISDNNYSITIAARGNELRTKKYYDKLFGESVYKEKTWQFSTYEQMFNSSLVIGTCSTTLTEALGWGKKVLYFDLSKGGIYSSCSVDGIWSLNSNDYSVFEKSMNKILSMSVSQYEEEAGTYSDYRICGVSNKILPSYEVMQKEISKRTL